MNLVVLAGLILYLTISPVLSQDTAEKRQKVGQYPLSQPIWRVLPHPCLNGG